MAMKGRGKSPAPKGHDTSRSQQGGPNRPVLKRTPGAKLNVKGGTPKPQKGSRKG